MAPHGTGLRLEILHHKKYHQDFFFFHQVVHWQLRVVQQTWLWSGKKHVNKQLFNSHGCLQGTLERELTGGFAPFLYSLTNTLTKSLKTPATQVILHWSNYKQMANNRDKSYVTNPRSPQERRLQNTQSSFKRQDSSYVWLKQNTKVKIIYNFLQGYSNDPEETNVFRMTLTWFY